MRKFIKIFLPIYSLVTLFGCSGAGTTIIVDDNTDLSNYKEVEWIITKSDSIIDFRESAAGYATINNSIVEISESDSLKQYNVTDLKIIYANTGTNIISYLLARILVSMLILGLLIGDTNING